MNKLKEKIIEEFDKFIYHRDNYRMKKYGGTDLYDDLEREALKSFILKAISQVQEETKKEIIQVVLEDVPTKYQDRLIKLLK